MSRSAAFSSMAAALVLAGSARAEPPQAEAAWTIGSDDCVSVNADGEPWDECGFQASAMNADGSRVLTVSVEGLVQVWDGDGREVAHVEWPSEHKGASGFPDGRAVIAGAIGVAVVHSNQVVVIDLADGRVLSRTLADAMTLDEFRFVAPDRLFVAIRDKEWRLGAREILLPTGEMREVSGAHEWTRYPSLGPQYWVVGAKAPFRVQTTRPDMANGEEVRACVPVDERYCLLRDLPGRYVHFIDVQEGSGRSIDVGRELGAHDSVFFTVSGEHPFAAVCAPSRVSRPERRECSLHDMLTGRIVSEFESGSNLRLDPGVDEQGQPEIRMTLYREESADQRRVSLDGAMRVIDPKGRANLAPPNGGVILPGATDDTSVLLDRSGLEVARLPFPAQRCGNGWPSWMGYCRVSEDGRKWLVDVDLRREGDEVNDNRGGLRLYRIPAGQEP